MFTFSDSDICRIEYGSEGYTYSYKMNKDELIISSADNVSFNYTSSDDKLILEKVLAMQQKLGGINGGIQESLVHIELEKES